MHGLQAREPRLGVRRHGCDIEALEGGEQGELPDVIGAGVEVRLNLNSGLSGNLQLRLAELREGLLLDLLMEVERQEAAGQQYSDGEDENGSMSSHEPKWSRMSRFV